LIEKRIPDTKPQQKGYSPFEKKFKNKALNIRSQTKPSNPKCQNPDQNLPIKNNTKEP